MSYGYDNATIRAGSKELTSKDHTDTEQEKGYILTITYIAGLSESIQRVCRDFDIKTTLKPGYFEVLCVGVSLLPSSFHSY